MKSLSHEISSLMHVLGADANKYLSVANNTSKLKEVIVEIWKDPAAHNLILSHINAFYVRKDERPKKGPDKDKVCYICEICSDDPSVRADLDLRRELIALGLQLRGVEFEEIHIKPSRRSVKEKHPFKHDIS